MSIEAPAWLTQAHFGHVGAVPSGLPCDEVDPDDEELAETPKDVTLMLGFDPLELEE